MLSGGPADTIHDSIKDAHVAKCKRIQRSEAGEGLARHWLADQDIKGTTFIPLGIRLQSSEQLFGDTVGGQPRSCVWILKAACRGHLAGV